MYKKPSRRQRCKPADGNINLVPLMDALFNLIFFVLFASSFIAIYQITSNLPLVSNNLPDKDKPLALTVELNQEKIIVRAGIPSKPLQTFNKQDAGYNWDELHEFLINMKKKYPTEDTVFLEPTNDIAYSEIVKLMDSVRVLKDTDEAFYGKDKEGVMVKLSLLYSNVLFSNITE